MGVGGAADAWLIELLMDSSLTKRLDNVAIARSAPLVTHASPIGSRRPLTLAQES